MTARSDTPPRKPSLFIRMLRFILSRVGRVSVNGVEHLAGTRGKIVVCNHVGWVDPLWMGYAVLPRTLHQMAKKELFENRLSAWFVRSGGGFPVDRGRPSAATIKHTIGLLEQGELVLIFPGGTRSQSGVGARRGAAMIALHAGAEVVPAHYDGPDRIRFTDLFRRPRIRITFGAPIVLPAESEADKAAAIRLTTELEEAMKALAGPKPEDGATPPLRHAA